MANELTFATGEVGAANLVCISAEEYKGLIIKSTKMDIYRNLLAEVCEYDDHTGEIYFHDFGGKIPNTLKVMDAGFYRTLLERSREDAVND